MKLVEQTSARVAKIAGKILAGLDGLKSRGRVMATVYYCPVCTVGELKALAASALTQAPDKPKTKHRVRVYAKRSRT